MIKEIFDIEPIQKNSLIVFLAICCVSFLQLYLFKKEILEQNAFLSIGLTLGISVCWVVTQIPAYFLFLLIDPDDEDSKRQYFYDKVVLHFGLFLLSWMLIITYISYEFQITLKNFIRLSISLMLIKFLFWIVFLLVKNWK